MSASWKNAERRAAKALGGKRNVRPSLYESGPDVVDVPGFAPEIKWRTKLPAIVTGALKQANGYAILGQKPLGIIFEKGSRRGVAVLWLDDLAQLVGGVASAPAAVPAVNAPTTPPVPS